MGGVTPSVVDARTVSKIEVRALSASEQALSIHIRNDEDSVNALTLLNDVLNPLIKEGEELFNPMIAAAYNAHQVALATKRKAVGGLGDAKEYLRRELASWALVIEDRQRAERLRLEQQARDEEARRQEREIEAIEASGDEDAPEQIQAVLDAPRPALVLPPEAFTVSTPIPGARDVFKAEVVNFREFYRAIGDGRIAVTMAEPKQSALDAMARAMGEGFNLPGCRLIKTKSVSSRSTR